MLIEVFTQPSNHLANNWLMFNLKITHKIHTEKDMILNAIQYTHK